MTSQRNAPGLLALAIFLSSTAWAANPINAGLGEVPDGVDRSSPMETARNFLNAAHQENYALAENYLDLSRIPVAQQASEGVRLARRLKFVLDRKVLVDLSGLSREADGSPGSARTQQIALLPLDGVKQPIRVVHVTFADHTEGWLFSTDTVRAIDGLFTQYGPPLAEKLPDSFYRHGFLELELWQWLGLIALGVLSLLFAWVASFALFKLVHRIGGLVHQAPLESFSISARPWARFLISSIIVLVGVNALYLTPTGFDVITLISRTSIMIAIAGLLLKGLNLAVELVLTNSAVHSDTPARLRGIRTQMSVLRRIAAAVIIVVVIALALVQIPAVRHIGVSLLASAGIAGVVLGLAAQKTIGALLAGIQITLTQPVRIGDTVVVEGESGTVEELTLTFVTVKLWDLRRMILPITYFLEKPFQNWSRGEADVSASVTLRVSPQADVDAIRGELKRLLRDDFKDAWDGKPPNLLVNQPTDEALVLRIFVGAKSLRQSGRLQDVLTARLGKFIQGKAAWLAPEDAAPLAHAAPAPVPVPTPQAQAPH